MHVTVPATLQGASEAPVGQWGTSEKAFLVERTLCACMCIVTLRNWDCGLGV